MYEIEEVEGYTGNCSPEEVMCELWYSKEARTDRENGNSISIRMYHM